MGWGPIIGANFIWCGYSAPTARRALVARGAAVLGKFAGELPAIEVGGEAGQLDQAAAIADRQPKQNQSLSEGAQLAVAPSASHRGAKGVADQGVSAPSRLTADLNDWRPAGLAWRAAGPRGRSPRGAIADDMGVASARPENRGLSALLQCMSIAPASRRRSRVRDARSQTLRSAHGVGGAGRVRPSKGSGENGVRGMALLAEAQGAAFGASERRNGGYARVSATVKRPARQSCGLSA
jgi:hypothetical protein